MPVLPPIAVAVPFAGAFVVLALAGLHIDGVGKAIALAAVAATTAVCGWQAVDAGDGILVHWFGAWLPGRRVVLGVDFAVDRTGATLATLVGVLAIAALVVSLRYFTDATPLFYALVLLFVGAMVGFSLSGDLFNLFVFFELMSVAAYALTAYKVEDKGALQGSLNFAVSNSIGAFCVLAGIALLYSEAGTLSLAQLGRTLASRPADGPIVVAFALVLGGFLVKGAAVPFHFWLGDAHAAAPTPVCVLFSGVMVPLGLYAVARVYWTVFSGVIPPGDARGVLVGFGIATAVVGAALSIDQHHLKRLLAFSTISHAGIVLVGIGLLDGRAFAGAALYVIAHGFVKGALFVATAVLVHRYGAYDDARLFGRAREAVFTGTAWCLGALALADLPPFGTYLGRGLIDESLDAHHLFVVTIVLSACAAVTGAAALRAAAHVFPGWGHVEQDESGSDEGAEEDASTKKDTHHTPPSMLVPLYALIAAGLIVGLAPTLSRHAVEAGERFVDRPTYAHEVLDSSSGSVRAPRVTAAPTTKAAVTGIATAAAAVALAAIVVFVPEDRRRSARRVTVVFGVPLRAIRAVHTGRVGDLTAWLTFGIAVFGGLVTIATR